MIVNGVDIEYLPTAQQREILFDAEKIDIIEKSMAFADELEL